MNSDTDALIGRLEAEYDLENGFLGLLRGGHFDTRAADRFLRLLGTIDLGDGDVIHRRVVTLLWFIPVFLQWQEHRLDEDEWAALRRVIDAATNQLERILGIP